MHYGPLEHGSVHGRLTVTSSDAVWATCSCFCGTRAFKVKTRNLSKGYVASCGCLAGTRVPETRTPVGDFSIVGERRVTKTSQPRTYWELECRHCGAKKWSFSGSIKVGQSLRCRCQIRKLATENTSSFWKTYAVSYKNGAEKRKLCWELDESFLRGLEEKPCAYCGDLPSPKKIHWRAFCAVPVHGIDRVDNSVGYTVKNSVPCCAACNVMKMDTGRDDFVRQCVKIAAHASCSMSQPKS
jgi:hypothetical protein